MNGHYHHGDGGGRTPPMAHKAAKAHSRKSLHPKSSLQAKSRVWFCILFLFGINIALMFFSHGSLESDMFANRLSSSLASGLFESWTSDYGLDSAYPPEFEASSMYSHTSPPPHLQDCVRLSRERSDLERSGPKGEYPSWVLDSNPGGAKPPWVEGDDADSLPLTRVAQRDIWVNQHPPNCSSKNVKFLLVEWLPREHHGLGSQLHVMSMFLSVAMAVNRVLAFVPGTYERAMTEHCQGDSHGSFECYFFPVTSTECIAEVKYSYFMKDYKLIEYQGFESFEKLEAKMDARMIQLHYHLWFLGRLLFNSEKRKIYPKGKLLSPLGPYFPLSKISKEPWLEGPFYIEYMNKSFVETNLVKYETWTSAQMLRYILRWPSPFMCHQINRIRHLSYGREIAKSVVVAQRHQQNLNVEKELKTKGGYSIVEPEKYDFERMLQRNSQPFIFRPILSIHVRQGDKSGEMKLFSFASHMYAAERIRLNSPDLKTVWLSTEMESVVEESKKYHGWTFYFTDLPRQRGDTSIFDYEKNTGIGKLVEYSFANLLIASECDHFVGTLGSNWNRLINELRLTNGRLKNGYIAINMCDDILRC